MSRHGARTFFTPEEKKPIDEAVAQAEKTTSGEIVPVLASRAGSYTHGLYHAAVSAAFFATLALFGVHCLVHEYLELGIWDIPIFIVVPVQFLALLGGYHLARWSPDIQRAFLPRALLQRRVELAAQRAFRELGLKNTKEGTGIMLYVSLFERVAVVLADKGIAAKCQKSTWDGVRDLLIAALKRGEAARGFVEAIAECGRILGKDFPAGADNPDELPNELRVLA
jgi:putative membrane protein